ALEAAGEAVGVCLQGAALCGDAAPAVLQAAFPGSRSASFDLHRFFSSSSGLYTCRNDMTRAWQQDFQQRAGHDRGDDGHEDQHGENLMRNEAHVITDVEN